MKKHLFFSALVLGGVPLSTQAGLLVEPVLGYSLGQQLDFSGGKNYDGGRGISYGGRLGYQTGPFQIGADYLQSSIDMDSSDFDENADITEWAAFVGMEFPILLRAYAGYIFSAEGETEINNLNVDLEDGTGFKLGLGLTPLPFLDVNLEYRNGTFDEFKAGGLKVKKEVDYQAYMLSISLPFDLL